MLRTSDELKGEDESSSAYESVEMFDKMMDEFVNESNYYEQLRLPPSYYAPFATADRKSLYFISDSGETQDDVKRTRREKMLICKIDVIRKIDEKIDEKYNKYIKPNHWVG